LSLLPSAPKDTSEFTAGLTAIFGNANIGDPVTTPARKTGLDTFAFEGGCGAAQQRWVDVLEDIHIDNCIEMIRYFTGNERHGAAT
jgi:hypothetical protein